MRRLVLLLVLAACRRDDARHAPAGAATTRAVADPSKVTADVVLEVGEAKRTLLAVEPRLWRQTGALAADDEAALLQAARQVDSARAALAEVPNPPAATLRQLAAAAADLARLARPVDEGRGPDEYSYSIKTAKEHLDFALQYLSIWAHAGYH